MTELVLVELSRQCNYCGSGINLKSHRVFKNENEEVDLSICSTCYQKYFHYLFDECDNCRRLYEVHFETFHVICGEMLCKKCKDTMFVK